VEVDLCGHATLASAHVLWQHRGEKADLLKFHTLSGVLTVERCGELLVLDFPARPAQAIAVPGDVEQALGAAPKFCGKARDYLMVYDTADQVRALRPDEVRILAWTSLASSRLRRARTSISFRASSRSRRFAGGFGDRVQSLHAGALLGRATGQGQAERAAVVSARWGVRMRAGRRARADWRTGRDISDRDL
jgi:predicted PhzF superfamily epimerase YddE/YHI9